MKWAMNSEDICSDIITLESTSVYGIIEIPLPTKLSELYRGVVNEVTLLLDGGCIVDK